ncbi:MAG TPA: VOC family protein [Polyangiaceae bacterium]|jgi:catechol 2,3-dioxygenase-like lactoylglutathione lyase family enzyme
MSSLDHIGINVSSYARSKTFYEKALAPLGMEVVMEYGSWCGMGRNKKPDFWFGEGVAKYQTPEQTKIITPVHVSFVARSRAEVDAFYEAAIAAGGKDNGKPGVRKEYHPNYYGAFVIDPDGHNVEAVIHTSP